MSARVEPAALFARHTTPDGRRFAMAVVRLSYADEGDATIEEIKVNGDGFEYSDDLKTVWRISRSDDGPAVFRIEDWSDADLEDDARINVPPAARIALLNQFHDAVTASWGADGVSL